MKQVIVQPQLAPNWRFFEWLNTLKPFKLETQRGRVVVGRAFQMPCLHTVFCFTLTRTWLTSGLSGG